MKKTIRFFAIAAVFAVMGTACDKDQAASIFPQDEEKTDEQKAQEAIKSIARHVTDLDNNHDGVGDFIQKYVL